MPPSPRARRASRRVSLARQPHRGRGHATRRILPPDAGGGLSHLRDSHRDAAPVPARRCDHGLPALPHRGHGRGRGRAGPRLPRAPLRVLPRRARARRPRGRVRGGLPGVPGPLAPSSSSRATSAAWRRPPTRCPRAFARSSCAGSPRWRAAWASTATARRGGMASSRCRRCRTSSATATSWPAPWGTCSPSCSSCTWGPTAAPLERYPARAAPRASAPGSSW
jgi:hypothetical protein